MTDQKDSSGAFSDELFTNLLREIDKNPPWTEDQQNCWNTFIKDLNNKPESPEKKQLLKKAHEKHYHDFESQFAAPKVQLIYDLSKLGYQDMMQKVKEGDYDF